MIIRLGKSNNTFNMKKHSQRLEKQRWKHRFQGWSNWLRKCSLSFFLLCKKGNKLKLFIFFFVLILKDLWLLFLQINGLIYHSFVYLQYNSQSVQYFSYKNVIIRVARSSLTSIFFVKWSLLLDFKFVTIIIILLFTKIFKLYSSFILPL